jgi:hypothetical protein
MYHTIEIVGGVERLMSLDGLQHFSDTLTIIHIRCVAQGARFWRSVDRNYGR